MFHQTITEGFFLGGGVVKFRFTLFFPKEEILKVANHSLEVLTKQMGFDTSGLILNANMSSYSLAQVFLSQNLWGSI